MWDAGYQIMTDNGRPTIADRQPHPPQQLQQPELPQLPTQPELPNLLRPVIGIPAALGRPTETGYIYQQVGAPYVRALEAVGALPLMLPVTAGPELIASMLDRVDGILLQGGGDIAPHLYGQECVPEVTYFNEETDRFELEVCRQCVDRDIPVLAICRGIQVLNVAMGGTLVQDLPTARVLAVPHRQKEPRHAPTHRVTVGKGSRLSGLVGQEDLSVNSFHHQAIDSLAEGLEITAWSEDEVIEAVEAPGKEFVVGVQFHPEETLESVPATAELFRGLVQAARVRKSAAGR